eukprot:gene13241-28028_t
MLDQNVTVEDVEVGGTLGVFKISQLTGSAFQEACLQKNDGNDNTGLRLHHGSHVACLFIKHLTSLVKDKHLLELGCGTGLLGLFTARDCEVGSILLTDGNDGAITLAMRNMHSIIQDSSVLDTISCSQLAWGHDQAQLFMRNRRPFEMLIGCELMYYNTEPTALLETVQDLLSDDGLFIHAHVFRRQGQEQELMDAFTAHGYITVEVKIESFIPQCEIEVHPEWYKVRCLVSGTSITIANMQSMNCQFEFIPFLVEQDDADESDEDDEPQIRMSAEALAALMNS